MTNKNINNTNDNKYYTKDKLLKLLKLISEATEVIADRSMEIGTALKSIMKKL